MRLLRLALVPLCGCAAMAPGGGARAAGGDRLPQLAGRRGRPAAGRREIYLPPGSYVLDKPLNLTGRNTRPKSEEYPRSMDFITLRGGGRLNTTIVGTMKDQPVIDLTDSSHCSLQDLHITSSTANVGVLLARDKSDGSAGSHYFSNILLDGVYSLADVYCFASEINRFVSCDFYNSASNGVSFLITPHNVWDVAGPHTELSKGSSNTEFRFYGCNFAAWGPGKSVGLWMCGTVNDLSLFGGYFSAASYTAILLDGTRGVVQDVSIEGVRIEAERAEHCLVARGRVDNVRLRTGSWISCVGEPICYEPGDGYGLNWDMAGLTLQVYDGLTKDYAPGPGNYRMARFASPLRSSRLEVLQNYFIRWTRDEAGATQGPTYPPGRAVVFEAEASGNRITVPGATRWTSGEPMAAT